jgi:uncharacterized protein
MPYVDTAMFGAQHSVSCVLDFFGSDHLMFGTDAPFDTEDGAYFIPATVSDIEGAVVDEAARAMIFRDNASRILGIQSDAAAPSAS